MAEAGEFTVKDWLTRIDSKQDQLDEKLDRALERLEGKADQRDVYAAMQRIAVIEQAATNRLELYSRMDKKLDKLNDQVTGENGLIKTKADRSELQGVWRLLVGSLSGAALAILAWALTFFVG